MDKKEKMRMMRDSGMKYKQIAEVMDVSYQYVAHICSRYSPKRFVPVGDNCKYPELRRWMNRNKVGRTELLRRMGIESHAENIRKLSQIMRGEVEPKKTYIDKMIDATGMTYERLFMETLQDK